MKHHFNLIIDAEELDSKAALEEDIEDALRKRYPYRAIEAVHAQIFDPESDEEAWVRALVRDAMDDLEEADKPSFTGDPKSNPGFIS